KPHFFTASYGRGSDWRIATLALGVLYMAGLLLVAPRFLAGAVRTARMVRQARPAAYAQALADSVRRALAIGRPVRALESPGAAVPMTWGSLRPVVLLPERAGRWPAGHLLELARALVERRSRADAPAMAETGDLEERVRAVLDRGRNRAPLNRRL